MIASNPDGVWNSNEGLDRVRSRSVILADLVVPRRHRRGVRRRHSGALPAFRMRQLTSRLNLRFEERLAERTRIAQELHDTLLQGFLSASMQVHVAADSLPADSPAKPTLTRALQLMRQVIEEGRNAVRGLRSSASASLDLEQAFSLVQQEVVPARRPASEIGFRVIVEGQQKPLHPLLRDDVYRIGREALINAFRHARAKKIEVELNYSPEPIPYSGARRWLRDRSADPEVGPRRTLGALRHAGDGPNRLARVCTFTAARPRAPRSSSPCRAMSLSRTILARLAWSGRRLPHRSCAGIGSGKGKTE